MRGGLVLGSARCGSTLVSRILRLHPDILSVSELFAAMGPWAFRPARLDGARFWAHLATPSRAMAKVANPEAAPSEFLYGRVGTPAHDPFLCPPLLAVTLPHLTDDPDALFASLSGPVRARAAAALADQYRALFADLAQAMGGRGVWVERSGGSLAAAGTLRAMFPEARPVLLLRDGAETALSMRDYPAARLAIWCWRWRWLGLDLLHPARHFGRGAVWPVVAAVSGRIGLRPVLDRQPGLAETGAFWSAVTIAGLRGLRGTAPLVLRYDALCRQPRPVIRALGEYLAGSAPEDWLDAAAALPQARPSRVDRLTAAERAELRMACAPGEQAISDFLARTPKGPTLDI